MLMRLIYTPCTHILTFTTICMGCPAHPRGVASAGFSHSNHEKLQLYNNLNLKFFLSLSTYTLVILKIFVTVTPKQEVARGSSGWAGTPRGTV